LQSLYTDTWLNHSEDLTDLIFYANNIPFDQLIYAYKSCRSGYQK